MLDRPLGRGRGPSSAPAPERLAAYLRRQTEVTIESCCGAIGIEAPDHGLRIAVGDFLVGSGWRPDTRERDADGVRRRIYRPIRQLAAAAGEPAAPDRNPGSGPEPAPLGPGWVTQFRPPVRPPVGLPMKAPPPQHQAPNRPPPPDLGARILRVLAQNSEGLRTFEIATRCSTRKQTVLTRLNDLAFVGLVHNVDRRWKLTRTPKEAAA